MVFNGDRRSTALSGFTALSSTKAIFSGYQLAAHGRREVTFRTTDAGGQWHRTVIPPPPGIPRFAE
jgi:hypothetical protein